MMIVSKENEQDALAALLGALQDMLSGYPSSTIVSAEKEDDTTTLPGGFVHPVHRHLHARFLVRGEQRILLKAMRKCRERMDQLAIM